MDSIEHQLGLILAGKAITDETSGIIDLSLDEYVKDLSSKGIETSVSSNFKPVVKKSVSYIAAAIVLNERKEVLMMQEAKSSCAGTWYVPAGRIEPGEDIVEGVSREVLEETGLHFEPKTLIMVESVHGNWFRFVFAGKTSGGELKTVSRADSESLQASWIDDLNQLSLRAHDVMKLIDAGKNYWSIPKEERHQDLLPQMHPHKNLLLRLVIVIRKKANNKVHVLISEKDLLHFPTCEINPTGSLHRTLKRYVQKIFESEPPPHKPHGILSLEHTGKPEHENDGFCLTILISCKVALEDVVLKSGYTWCEVSPSYSEKLLKRLGKNKTAILNVI